MMHGPDGLGKPHILPLCLKEGSTERSRKKIKSFTIALSCRRRHLQRDWPPEKGTESVRVSLSKVHIILRTGDHLQCTSKAAVAAERDCTLGFSFKPHKQSLSIQHILFACVKEGDAVSN